MVLLHDKVTFSLLWVGLDVTFIEFKTFFEISEGIRESHKFSITQTSIEVIFGSLWVSLDSLFILLDGNWELTSLESFLSSLIGLLSKFGVNITLFILDFLESINSSVLFLNRLDSVLDQRFIVPFNTLMEVILFAVDGPESGVELGQLFKIVDTVLLLDLESQFTNLDGLIQFSHLNIAGGLVIVVEEFGWLKVNSLLVGFKGILEILLLIKIISLDLLFISLI